MVPGQPGVGATGEEEIRLNRLYNRGSIGACSADNTNPKSTRSWIETLQKLRVLGQPRAELVAAFFGSAFFSSASRRASQRLWLKESWPPRPPISRNQLWRHPFPVTKPGVFHPRAAPSPRRSVRRSWARWISIRICFISSFTATAFRLRRRTISPPPSKRFLPAF